MGFYTHEYDFHMIKQIFYEYSHLLEQDNFSDFFEACPPRMRGMCLAFMIEELGIDLGTILDKMNTILKYQFTRVHLDEVDIPPSIQTIEERAFDRSDISKVNMRPSKVRKIPKDAFKTSSIQKISLPTNVKSLSIEHDAFAGCVNLNGSVQIDSNSPTISFLGEPFHGVNPNNFKLKVERDCITQGKLYFNGENIVAHVKPFVQLV